MSEANRTARVDNRFACKGGEPRVHPDIGFTRDIDSLAAAGLSWLIDPAGTRRAGRP